MLFQTALSAWSEPDNRSFWQRNYTVLTKMKPPPRLKALIYALQNQCILAENVRKLYYRWLGPVKTSIKQLKRQRASLSGIYSEHSLFKMVFVQIFINRILMWKLSSRASSFRSSPLRIFYSRQQLRRRHTLQLTRYIRPFVVSGTHLVL